MTISLSSSCSFDFSVAHPSWIPYLEKGLQAVDLAYLKKLTQSKNWLPGPASIFNAFSLPLYQVNYVLFGESPYPRKESANGYAFWDADVDLLWSNKGLSKKVNRATSLRNFIKMLLVAEERLDKNNTNQEAITKIDKHDFLQTNQELFSHLLEKGFLLLNTSLVLQENAPLKDANAWHPFMREILHHLLKIRQSVTFLLFGNIAKTIHTLIQDVHPPILNAEHPYNLSFITNPTVIHFFKPLHLLRKNKIIETPT